MTRLQRVVRREAFVWDASFYLTIGWIVFGALPFIAILVLSLVFGNYPTDADPSPEGYPAFTPPWWAMYPLVAFQVVATVVAVPFLLGHTLGDPRQPSPAGAILMIFTVSNGGSAFLRDGTFWGTEWLTLVSALCCGALALRMIAGWMRLVPLSWREYLDDDGTVVAPRDVVRDTPPRPWDGIGRLLSRRSR